MKIRNDSDYTEIFSLKSTEDIYSDLEMSRACFERGEYEDFDDALDGISEKYGL